MDELENIISDYKNLSSIRQNQRNELTNLLDQIRGNVRVYPKGKLKDGNRRCYNKGLTHDALKSINDVVDENDSSSLNKIHESSVNESNVYLNSSSIGASFYSGGDEES